MRAALLLALALVAAPPTAPPVRIVSQQARWTGPGPTDALGDDREPWFLISGALENQGTQPLAHVRLIYELLADGVVVAREFGYNRRAEALREPQVEAGRVDPCSLALPPLAPGERDAFRMLFLRGDAPRFDEWRVRVDAAPLAPTPPP
ncbi:MAG: hypothetical protein SF182_01985 [Deltaproteobacteria bacterium]|nr:hypothetical protein [Deltaproteobacteria bacterium]